MRKITKIITHCSDSDSPFHDDVEVIRKWHVKENGWSAIGYHYVITKDGRIHFGRPKDKVGAHCKGHNHDSIGICLTGKTQFTLAQFGALVNLTNDLQERHNIPTIATHSYFNKEKTCPNFRLDHALKLGDYLCHLPMMEIPKHKSTIYQINETENNVELMKKLQELSRPTEEPEPKKIKNSSKLPRWVRSSTVKEILILVFIISLCIGMILLTSKQ